MIGIQVVILFADLGAFNIPRVSEFMNCGLRDHPFACESGLVPFAGSRLGVYVVRSQVKENVLRPEAG